MSTAYMDWEPLSQLPLMVLSVVSREETGEFSSNLLNDLEHRFS
jgi:hypothetical protein